MVGAQHGRGMTSVYQTLPHCVNQMGKTHSKPLAARHGRGTAWARHAMCESALIASYLTGRYQKVILNNHTNNNSSSKWEMIKNGVPQDSIIGPLFFLLYINYLPKIITKNNSMVLFADDTSLLINGFRNISMSPESLL